MRVLKNPGVLTHPHYFYSFVQLIVRHILGTVDNSEIYKKDCKDQDITT